MKVEPRPPATRTSGAVRRTDPTASPHWRWPQPGSSEVRLGNRRRRGVPAWPVRFSPSRAAALAEASGRALRARDRRLLGPDRRGLERDPLRAPAVEGRGDARVPAPGARRGPNPENGFKLEQAPPAGADRARRAARKDAAARGRESRRRLHQLPPALGDSSGSSEELSGAPGDFELLCRFFCLPGEREQVEPVARFMFSSYVTVPVYAAFYRWLGHSDAIAESARRGRLKDRQRAAEAALGT